MGMQNEKIVTSEEPQRGTDAATSTNTQLAICPNNSDLQKNK